MTARLHRGALALSAFLVTLLLAGCGGGNLMARINSPGGWGCCGTLSIIISIIFIIEVIGSTKSTGSKVLWSLLIFFFPFGGSLIYYFFGR